MPALILVLAGACAADAMPIERLVPRFANGWRAHGPDATYNRKTLYDYIDGAGEVYLAYGFRRVLARRMVRTSHSAIIVDVFDMGSHADAYGVFTFERESEHVGIGQDSEYAAGLLRFWKGDYFVSVLADRETADSKEAVMALGRAIASRIKPEGERPKVIGLLPDENLVRTSIRYFHEKSGLDYHYFVADENILGLARDTEAVLAQYAADSSKCQLLLVRYPEAARARTAFGDFGAAYMPEAGADSTVRTENGKWVSAALRGDTIVAVFDAPTQAYAESLVRRTISNVEDVR